MRYEGAVYRPPSEAYSLIIQATIGCSHNKCTFCNMYKEKRFRMRSLTEIIEDLEMARKSYRHIKRIFLADGDALALKTEYLKQILIKIRELFPECERVGIYSAPKDILRKTKEELKELHELGLGIAYLGIESGSEQILKTINKGVTSEQMIEAGKKMVESGIKLSVTIISGLGGQELWEEHAIESARVVNEINPHYLGLLTLMVEPEVEMYQDIRSGKLKLLTPEQVMLETQLLIEKLNVKGCVFRSNHASNYIPLEGTLPQDKERLLNQIKGALQRGGFKSDYHRRL
ncbi:radical SAM protein [Serpentinicella alkaliphila]|uniref:Radical SAM family protein n=1 Tax=Serpentinicella alkaliphila TaxID=1734049 RepID=A0A4V2T4C0_9FIRM|nr:radical SAM protein [Serpentinicella alkaliphila]QUH24559.1 B12-binding domain-containing radical SAM protein [Serpentinicella alkaliphila]TCQ04654.1 radical SAM family protein [Serpentinicella alkaliphila]